MISVIVIFVGYVIFMILSPEKASFIHNEDAPKWILYVFQPVIVLTCSRILFFILGTFLPKKTITQREKLYRMRNRKYLQLIFNGTKVIHVVKTSIGTHCLPDNLENELIKIFTDEIEEPFVEIQETHFSHHLLSKFFFLWKKTTFYLHLPKEEANNPIENTGKENPVADTMHMT